MDLVIKYMILLLLCFGLNIGLVSNSSFANKNRRNFPLIYIISLFLISIITINFSKNLLFLSKYFNFYLMICGVIFIIITYLYENYENLRDVFAILISIISLFLFINLISLSNLNNVLLFNIHLNFYIISLLISILISIFILLGKKIGENLEKVYVYPNILGEYMIIESIFLFILGLTYSSVKNLDYTLFTSFLILSPSYMVCSVIILLIIIIIIGVFIGDNKN
ncbi:MAG: hypothetical protein ACI4VU_07655 [Methanobrevibacter sp.]